MTRAPVQAPDIGAGRVELSHGAGGRAMAQMIRDLFARELGNAWLAQGDDSVRLPAAAGRLAVSTDVHVVSPLFFPGGDIGCLSVHGTVNDVAMAGARPLWLTAGFVLEEGFPLADLARIVASMAEASRAAGVPVVAGDTKVVERGKADGVFIATTGIGAIRDGVEVSGANARAGDAVLVSGPIGDHGMAIMSLREHLGFESPIVSDTAPLHDLVARLLDAVPGVHVLRDPTRGGLAATLNEIAHQSGVGIVLDEARIPVRPAVAAACELLGIDPLDVACEGRMIVICPAQDAERARAALRAAPLGRGAEIVGEVVEDARRFVRMRTRFGGQRMVDWLAGAALPRIC